MGPKRKNTSDGATTEATATKKSKAGNASEDAPAGEAASADNTALHFFKNQHYGSKGIRAELKRAAELGPFRMDASKYYQFFEAQDALDPLRDTYKSRLSRDTAYEWLWLGVSNANILVYGVGDKRLLLDDFMSNFLQGEDVLELTGNPNPGYANDLHSNVSLKSAKAVLIGIAEKYLKLENLETVISENLLTFARNITERLNAHYGRAEGGKIDSGINGSNVLERRSRNLNPSMPKWKGRYAHCQDRLYIVVHELCGPFFENYEVQKCFSILASCESVSIIASVETLNLALTWDADVLHHFDWKYFHLPTYMHHKLPLDHPIIGASANDILSRKGSNAQKGENGGQGLDAVLDSLTNNHRHFLQKICKEVVQRQITANAKPKADPKKQSKSLSDAKLPNELSFSDAFAIAGNALIVRSKPELKTLIAEYIDHKVLELDESNSQEVVRLLLSDADIKRLAEVGNR